MTKIKTRQESHIRKHKRVRRKVSGSPEYPRLCVYRSIKNIYVQIIDDLKGITLASASSQDKDIRGKLTQGGNKEAAKQIGLLVAKRAKEKGIENVIFDRGGYLYHGRVKSLADGAREGGLKF